MTRRIVVVGDALLDRDIEGTVSRLCPDAPVPVVDRRGEHARPGGAGLAAALTAADGHDVTLVTALGDDLVGVELRALLDRHGVRVLDLGLAGSTPEKIRVRAVGRSLIRLDRGERRPAAVGDVTAPAWDAIAGADAVLVSDYGRGVAVQDGVRRALERAVGEKAMVWDPHPAGPQPVAGVTLATPNAVEAQRFAGVADIQDGTDLASRSGMASMAAVGHGRALLERWGCQSVCVTLAADGAVVVSRAGHPVLVPAPAIQGGDPCGAGDRFASRAVGVLADGSPALDAVLEAVASASSFVGAGGAASPRIAPAVAPLLRAADRLRAPRIGTVELARRARAGGRRVVATGGCFDLLHAGHIRTLQAARALGDLLIVCLNSDRSVTALKGPGRPIVPQAARTAVLEALACVDGVVVFDEATPQGPIRRLQPDVWVKGGDYSEAELPEARAVREQGGEVVLLPYLPGHSTTRLIEEAVQGHAA